MTLRPGDRVRFTAAQGRRSVTCRGTVVPSTFRNWCVVELDTGPVVEVKLTRVSLDNTPAPV